jgi:ADP-heptose:LPS heptosyltransferase
MPSILILRALGLGDFLTAVPAYRALRRTYPDHELVLAAPPELAGLAALTRVVDRVLPTRGLHRIGWDRSAPPAVAVNLHGRGPLSHRYIMQLRPQSTIAFASPPAPYLDGPAWRTDEHEVRRWCRLLDRAGIPASPDELGLPRPPLISPAPEAAIVHPGAGADTKRWPPRRFAAVAAELQRAGHRVLVTGSPAERGLAQEVAAAAAIPATDVLAGTTSLVELAALVASASVVIAADTGIAHLATAYRTPSVVLFGPAASPREWGPPAGRPQHFVLRRSQLAAITAREVISAARRVIAPAGAWR